MENAVEKKAKGSSREVRWRKAVKKVFNREFI